MIRDASSDVKAEPTEKITLRAQVPSTIEQPRGEDDGVVSSVTVRLFVSYTGGKPSPHTPPSPLSAHATTTLSPFSRHHPLS